VGSVREATKFGQTPRARALNVAMDRVAEFGRRWKVTELEVFGSFLREDFGPESDVDLLVTFAPDARWSLFDMMEMEEELTAIFGRRVDLLSRRAIEQSENWMRRKGILGTAETLYVAR
jgi:predicted nucleotidyltransferase